jgi:hypothetical protein
MTQCSQDTFSFAAHFSRRVEAGFTADRVSSDGGALLLRETDRKVNLLGRLAACFGDGRDQDQVEHTVAEMVSQRIYGLALGYEDLNDHEQLRTDPLLGVLSGKRKLDSPLAGKSTLNRLELVGRSARYHKISYSAQAIDQLLGDLYIESQAAMPERIVLDLDATDIPLYGHQPERFFHGYYDSYCYLPLYIFAEDQLLCARLRPANQDAAAGSLEEVKRIVAQLRAHWPEVKIILRADSGFCREELMAWCEQNRIDYVFGLARNQRLRRIIGKQMHEAQLEHQTTGKPSRVFTEFDYRTHKSWSRPRRVVAKAEFLDKGENPRFIVTSLPAEQWAAQQLYEKFYCARGEMGVSSQGHINQPVEVRTRPIDSSLVAGEAPWRESKTVRPSDNMLRKEYAQLTRLQRAVNADVASSPANPEAETVHNVRKQQEPIETSPMRRLSPAGYQRRHGGKVNVETGEALGVRRRNLAEEVSAITVSGKCWHRRQGGGSGRSTVDGSAAKRFRKEGPGPVSISLTR